MDDERSSALHSVLAQERATVAEFKQMLTLQEPGPVERRLRALMAYHKSQIRNRQQELRHG